MTANGDPRHGSPVLAWLAEPTAARALGTPPFPDSVVVLQGTDEQMQQNVKGTRITKPTV